MVAGALAPCLFASVQPSGGSLNRSGPTIPEPTSSPYTVENPKGLTEKYDEDLNTSLIFVSRHASVFHIVH